MWLESDSVYPYQSPYIGDEDQHTETYLPFSVSPLSPPRNALYRGYWVRGLS